MFVRPSMLPLLVTLTCFSLGWAQLTVLAPPGLVSQFADTRGAIPGSTATFGAPFYGQKVMGRLVWNEPQMHKAHCHESDYDVPEADGTMINIVMVRRGICSFTRKTRIASSKGAHAVIFVDSEESYYTRPDLQNMIVGDDGYGQGIEIPSLFITKADGAKLIEATTRGEVLVELAWTVPAADTTVMLDLWMTPGSERSSMFLKNFAHNRKTLNEVVSFTPHYNVIQFDSDDFKIFLDLCTDSSGEFCMDDPDGSGPVTGKDVLDEAVRQLCIHEQTKVVRAPGVKVDYAGKWWDYVSLLPDICPVDGETEDNRFGNICAEKVMQRVRLDPTTVNSCIMQTKTEKLRTQRDNKGWSPDALRINGWRYMGTLDSDLVTQAVCTAFIVPAPECDIIVKERNPFDTTSHVVEKGIKPIVVIITLVVIVGLGFCALIFYKRAMMEQITSQVRDEVTLEMHSQMGQYSQLPRP